MTLKCVVSQLWAFKIIIIFYYLFGATDLELIHLIYLCVLCTLFVCMCLHTSMYVCMCMCKRSCGLVEICVMLA
jgi:hypothetical protein